MNFWLCIISILFLIDTLHVYATNTSRPGNGNSSSINQLIYGFTPQELFSNRLKRGNSHFILSWPNKWNTLPLPKPDLVLEIGQNLLNNLITQDLVLMILDKIQGLPLPIEHIITEPMAIPGVSSVKWFGKQMGTFELVLKNIRVHKTMLTKFEPPKHQQVQLEDDALGGKLKDERPKEFYEKVLINSLKRLDKMNREKWEAQQKEKFERSKRLAKKAALKRASTMASGSAFDWMPGSRSGDPARSSSSDISDEETFSTGMPAFPDHLFPDEEFDNNWFHPDTQFDDDGAQYVSKDSNYQSNKQTLAFFGQKCLHFAIKGLNVVLTGEYELRGVSGWLSKMKTSGRVYVRILNSVAMVEAEPAQHPVTGTPTIKVNKLPQVYFGKVQSRYDKSASDSLLTRMTNTISKRFEKLFPIILSKIIQDELPIFTDLIMQILEDRILASFDDFLEDNNFSAPEWPQLAFEDLRWSVNDYKLELMAYVRHISKREQSQMLDLMKTWLEKTRNMDTSKSTEKGPTQPAALFKFGYRSNIYPGSMGHVSSNSNNNNNEARTDGSL